LPTVKCNVCDHPIELPERTAEDDRFTCPNCFAQLAFKILNGRGVARCAVCSKGMVECPEDCERKFEEREKRGFFDIKL